MSTVDIEKLVQLIAAGIRVFRTRDGKPLTDDECLERARNCCAAVLSEYEIKERRMKPDDHTRAEACELAGISPRQGEKAFPKVAELRELYAQGKPEGHGRSCACRDCRIFNQSRRAQ